MPISRRPVAPGNSPAPSPIHAHANIWYGIHGPTPPVMSADANSVVQPRLNPKPGPSARPPITRRKKIVSTPAVPAPSGRIAAPSADSTPSSASDFASRPPSETSASTTASTRSSSAPKMTGAMLLAPLLHSLPTRNGHANASTPKTDASASAAIVRGPIRTARGRRVHRVAFESSGARSSSRRRRRSGAARR